MAALALGLLHHWLMGALHTVAPAAGAQGQTTHLPSLCLALSAGSQHQHKHLSLCLVQVRSGGHRSGSAEEASDLWLPLRAQPAPPAAALPPGPPDPVRLHAQVSCVGFRAPGGSWLHEPPGLHAHDNVLLSEAHSRLPTTPGLLAHGQWLVCCAPLAHCFAMLSVVNHHPCTACGVLAPEPHLPSRLVPDDAHCLHQWVLSCCLSGAPMALQPYQ